MGIKWNHVLQRSVYKISINAVPDKVMEIMDEKTFKKSQCYQLDKSSYSLVHNLYKQIEFLVSWIGLMGVVWHVICM